MKKIKINDQEVDKGVKKSQKKVAEVGADIPSISDQADYLENQLRKKQSMNRWNSRNIQWNMAANQEVGSKSTDHSIATNSGLQNIKTECALQQAREKKTRVIFFNEDSSAKMVKRWKVLLPVWKRPIDTYRSTNSSSGLPWQGLKLTVVRWPESTKSAVGPPNHSCAVVQWATGSHWMLKYRLISRQSSGDSLPCYRKRNSVGRVHWTNMYVTIRNNLERYRQSRQLS